MIPKIFHRIWLDEVVPPIYEVFWMKFQELHPDWEFRTWNDSTEALDFMDLNYLWDEVNPIAGRTDLLRYEIMAKIGGVYVDTDVEPLQSFESLLEVETPFLAWEAEDRLCPTVIGAPPNNPPFVEFVEYLPGWIDGTRGKTTDPVLVTGPIPLTEFMTGREDIRRLPPYYFYPVGPLERKLIGGDYHPDSLAVHHWSKGWGKKKSCCGK